MEFFAVLSTWWHTHVRLIKQKHPQLLRSSQVQSLPGSSTRVHHHSFRLRPAVRTHPSRELHVHLFFSLFALHGSQKPHFSSSTFLKFTFSFRLWSYKPCGALRVQSRAPKVSRSTLKTTAKPDPCAAASFPFLNNHMDLPLYEPVNLCQDPLRQEMEREGIRGGRERNRYHFSHISAVAHARIQKYQF